MEFWPLELESSNRRIVDCRSGWGAYSSIIGLNRRSYISQLKICIYKKTKGYECRPLMGYHLGRPTIRRSTIPTIRGYFTYIYMKTLLFSWELRHADRLIFRCLLLGKVC